MTTTTSAVLALDQQIIELESDISEARFIRRCALMWLLAGNLTIASAVVTGNILIDFSHPGSGRSALNFFGIVAFLTSLGGSVATWYHWRTQVREISVQLHQLTAEKNSLQTTETASPDVSSAFHFYYDSVPGFRDDYRRNAEKYRGRHNLFQLTVIVGSILTSVATTASAEQGFWSWLAVALSATVSISAGIIAYFKFRERSLNLQQTADSIDLEIQAYALRIRRYRGLTPEQASASFAEEVERLREEQRKKELQLEQPPEATPNQRPQLAQ
ncbi:DUF4231 domain-containing protein [Streptomyces populi]